LFERSLWLGREDEAFTSGSDEVLQGGSIREIVSRCSRRKKIKDKEGASDGVDRYTQKSGSGVVIQHGAIIVV
jgi:hypothetical protein